MGNFFKKEAYIELDKLDGLCSAVKTVIENMNRYQIEPLKDLLIMTSGNTDYLLMRIGIEDNRDSVRYEYTHDLADKIRILMFNLVEHDFQNSLIEVKSMLSLLCKIRSLIK